MLMKLFHAILYSPHEVAISVFQYLKLYRGSLFSHILNYIITLTTCLWHFCDIFDSCAPLVTGFSHQISNIECFNIHEAISAPYLVIFSIA